MKKLFTLSVLALSFRTFSQVMPASNVIGVDVSTMPENASFGYNNCFALGDNLGMGQVGLFQNWSALETAPMVYDMTLMDIANVYYPAYSMPVDLTIAPIATNQLEVPADLASTAFNSPTMINRFRRLLDTVKAHIPALTLSSLVIGSEHDIYLGTNATEWSDYGVFYDSVSAYARTLWPGLRIATELTYNGLVTKNSLCQALNTNSDYIGVSYYPLNTDFTVQPVSVIPADFNYLCNVLYTTKPICFYQYGYPSSIACNSSEALQANFITQTFTSWDSYPTRIKLIDFTWLHDLDTATVNYFAAYYGITDTVFMEYLRTLGLRTWNGNGTDKAAFIELECQAKARGFNALPITCNAGIEEQDQISFSVFPNPAQDQIRIEGGGDADVSIYDSRGQLILSGQKKEIDVSEFPEGIYLISLSKGNSLSTQKLILQR